jgi:hypothetical protein
MSGLKRTGYRYRLLPHVLALEQCGFIAERDLFAQKNRTDAKRQTASRPDASNPP